MLGPRSDDSVTSTVPGPVSTIRTETFSPKFSMTLAEVKTAVPALASLDRNWKPVRRAASRRAVKTSGGLARTVMHRVPVGLISLPRSDVERPILSCLAPWEAREEASVSEHALPRDGVPR